MGFRRFNFMIDEDLSQRIAGWPEGSRSPVLRTLLKWAADIHDRHGAAGLGAIVDGEFHLESDKLRKRA